MNKTAIKNFAIWARNKLIEDITYQMRLIGIDKEGIKKKLPQSTADVEFYDIGTRDPYQVTGAAVGQRSALVKFLEQKAKESDFVTAYENVIEEVAYTWFNRLIAIRFMEFNDYLPGGLRVLSSASANKIEPELVTTPFDSDLEFTSEEREQIMEWQENCRSVRLRGFWAFRALLSTSGRMSKRQKIHRIPTAEFFCFGAGFREIFGELLL